MELISQHAKRIMEECKARARDAGLIFDSDTLEYIVTNRDLLELSPKHMIPTLYDYWVHDVDLLREQGKYELYPSNPYETVINSRPAISYYNDNNPDWLNVMIFYHVIAHIDFFQNNLYFKHTWGDDFVGRALADKRLLSRLRSDHGRWVDYVIEFARGIDNLVGFYQTLSAVHRRSDQTGARLDYYFDIFLQKVKQVPQHQYLKQIEAYNQALRDSEHHGENVFFAAVIAKYPEFESLYERHRRERLPAVQDVTQHILEYSPFLRKNENRWMKSVIEVVRGTSLYFQPQIRTKILNEGWASFWHERLFLDDERIEGHEVEFARVHAKVTGLPRVGINPYAIGMRMLYDLRDRADKGKLSYEYFATTDSETRKRFDQATGAGLDTLFRVREEFCDFTLINTFCDQEFIDRFKLFVAGRRLNPERRVWEYFVKSRRVSDYRQMLIDSLYHPPSISVDTKRSSDQQLRLVHHFEGKQLVREYIDNTMLGLEYLWGGPVHLETSILKKDGSPKCVEYTINDQRLTVKAL